MNKDNFPDILPDWVTKIRRHFADNKNKLTEKKSGIAPTSLPKTNDIK